MKKIVYNSRLKKILISIFIIIMIMEYFIPIKVFAATSVADDMKAIFQEHSDVFGTASITKSKCNKIINTIKKADSKNSVTSSKSGNKKIIKIKVVNTAIVKTAFKKYMDEHLADLIVANNSDYFVVETINEKTEESKSENKEKDSSNTTVAEDLRTVLNNNASTLGVYNISLESCKNIISYIEKADSRNYVKSSKSGKNITINIGATSKTTVKDAFWHKGGLEENSADLLANNNYKFVSVKKVDPNSVKEGEKDSRTKEQKVADWIVSNYPEITPDQAKIIVENKKYKAEFDDDGKVKNVKLNLSSNDYNSYGISNEARNTIDEAQNSGDGADLGGILLSPIFYLVNFIADAIMSNLQKIMTGEGSVTGIDVLVLSPVDTGYNKTDEISVTMSNALGVIQYPNLKYTPEQIFSGEIDLLSIDFISGKNANGETITGGWQSVRNVISAWYRVLRMVAIIGLLSVLIYTGIKIIISSNAKDKAKYKEWIINWLVAVAILFSMHYIMSFIISVTGEISKLFSNACRGIKVVPSQGEPFITNLMGLVRFMIQSENMGVKIGYEVMYIALIVYTIKFTVVYLKRVLNMAFLTLIAPIVALTYPIDKINDGQAQGFNMWLKEYIFNALLQPMHYLMYYILVGSAISIAANNPIYGIVVLAFMSEAERLLKKIFGFDKAGGGTVGGMTGAFAAGAIASSVKDIARMAKLPGGNGNKNIPGGNGSGSSDNTKPTEKPSFDEVFSEDSSNTLIGDGGHDPEDSNVSDDQEPEPIDSEDNESDEFRSNSLDGGEDESRVNRNGNQGENQELSETDEETELDGENSDPDLPESEPVVDNPPTVPDDGTPIRDKASRIKRGASAVGKRLIKPVWDVNKSRGYNFTRLAKKGGRAVLGASVGITAAAVQAGISITDGKYHPMEGLATFTAGYAGGGRIAKATGSLVDTYRDGAEAGDKEAQMWRAQARFADRDDVIEFNKQNYADPKDRKERVERQRDNYLTSGITDLKEMKSGMKYADTLMGNTNNLDSEQIKEMKRKADRRAVATIQFRKTLQEQGQLGSVYDKDKREKYIRTMQARVGTAEEKARVRKQYENAFKSVVAYDNANKK